MAILNGVKCYLTMVLTFISLIASNTEHLFTYLWTLYVLLGELSVQVLSPILNWAACLPGVELCEFFIYFGDQTIVWGIIGKYVFPYSWFSFHFNTVFFSHAEAFYFDEVPFVHSFLYVPCIRGHISENIAMWNIWDFPACVPLRTFMVSWLIFQSSSILSLFLCVV